MTAAKQYLVPALIAVVLHSFLAYTLNFATGIGSASEDTVIKPTFLTATLMNLEEGLEIKPSAAEVRPTFAAPSTKFENVNVEPELKADEPQKQEDEQLSAEQSRILQELRGQTLDSAVSNERNQLLEDYVKTEYNEYVTDIYLAIVTNWVRPPSARNNMVVVVLVELFPNGDLNSVAVVESSGNSAFDRSAVAAVNKAAPFRVPSDSTAFETSFRTIKLRFKPEDLLR